MTKKKCNKCGGYLVSLSSMDKRICNDCFAEYPWKLDPGQKSILEDRVGPSENTNPFLKERNDDDI